MSLIQCDEHCRFQKEGYCRLEALSTVNAAQNRCPYFKPVLFDNGNSFFQASDTYEF